PRAPEQVVQIPPRNPSGKFHGIAQSELLAQFVQPGARQPMQPTYYQRESGPNAPEFRERPQQTVEVLVRVQSRDRQQKRFRTPPRRDLEKGLVDTQPHDSHLRLGQAVVPE